MGANVTFCEILLQNLHLVYTRKSFSHKCSHVCILFNPKNSGAGIYKNTSQRTSSWSNLKHHITFLKISHIHKLLINRRIQHVMLAEGFAREAAFGVESTEGGVVIVFVYGFGARCHYY